MRTSMLLVRHALNKPSLTMHCHFSMHLLLSEGPLSSIAGFGHCMLSHVLMHFNLTAIPSQGSFRQLLLSLLFLPTGKPDDC